MTQATKRSPRFLLLMPDDIRYEIERSAIANGRTLTKEINLRLRDSLNPNATLPSRLAQAIDLGRRPPLSYTDQPTAIVGTAKDNGPANALTDIDRAMLVVFHNLPPEKQLALLSLFR